MKPKTVHCSRKQPKTVTLYWSTGTGERMRRITIPRILFPVLGLVTGLLALALAVSISGWQDTQTALHEEKLAVALLEEQTEAQQLTIGELEEQFSAIDMRLASLAELEIQVMGMVGLDVPEEPEGPEGREPEFQGEPDWSADGERTQLMSSGAVGSSDSLQTLTGQASMVSRSDTTTARERWQPPVVDIERLEALLETRKTSMGQLLDNVEDQLAYLDAQPNLWPAQGRLTSGFGTRRSPTNRRRTEFHSGIDIAAPSGTRIVAAGSGRVIYAGYRGGYGNKVIISHGYGYTSLYAHNRRNLVSVGDQVEKGEVIAQMGRTGRATGTHVHFEIHVNGTPVNPASVLK